MSGYEIYLMIELAKCHRFITHELEYDIAWESGKQLYAEFTKSEFNVDSKSEYDCIEDFLNKKEEDVKYYANHRSKKDEVDLNIRALQASFDGDIKLSNATWSLIELKGYERLDYTMTLPEMKEKAKTKNY